MQRVGKNDSVIFAVARDARMQPVREFRRVREGAFAIRTGEGSAPGQPVYVDENQIPFQEKEGFRHRDYTRHKDASEDGLRRAEGRLLRHRHIFLAREPLSCGGKSEVESGERRAQHPRGNDCEKVLYGSEILLRRLYEGLRPMDSGRQFLPAVQGCGGRLQGNRRGDREGCADFRQD